MQSRFQDNIYHLPQARSGGVTKAIHTAESAPTDMLFVDMNYAMAARLCPQGKIRKVHPAALLGLRPRHIPLACNLFGYLIDGFEMTTLLNRIGYQGQLTIVRPAVPDPELIRAELSEHAQGFRLRFIRDHWLGGAACAWSTSERAQRLRKTTRFSTIPRR